MINRLANIFPVLHTKKIFSHDQYVVGPNGGHVRQLLRLQSTKKGALAQGTSTRLAERTVHDQVRERV